MDTPVAPGFGQCGMHQAVALGAGKGGKAVPYNMNFKVPTPMAHSGVVPGMQVGVVAHRYGGVGEGAKQHLAQGGCREGWVWGISHTCL